MIRISFVAPIITGVGNIVVLINKDIHEFFEKNK
jgi:hypothetical protein